jgi:hypothetical protein
LIVALARAGYAAKGIVYFLIGTAAILFVAGHHNRTADFSGVMIQLLHLPFGMFLLAGLAIGFAGYSLWCFIQAVMDTEHKGHNFGGVIVRCFYGLVGVVYAGLAWSALKLLPRLEQ